VGKYFKLIVIASVLALAFINANLSAEDASSEQKQNRFDLLMMSTAGIKNTIIPAVLLDTYKGIVWTCNNLQDARSLWKKTDLGQNGDKSVTRKKYSAKMIEGGDVNTMLATVLDNEEGTIWVCPNVIDNKSIWMKRPLSLDLQTEEAKNKN
jgi:hypothetical protein